MALRSERRFLGAASNVKPGMMIEFNYSKKYGDQSSNSYTVLVIDPDLQNDHANEPQLHGFVIHELSDRELVEFLASFGKSVTLGDTENRRTPVIVELNTDEAYNAFRSSRYVKDRSYRTFNLSRMTSVRQILLGSPD